MELYLSDLDHDTQLKIIHELMEEGVWGEDLEKLAQGKLSEMDEIINLEKYSLEIEETIKRLETKERREGHERERIIENR